MLTGVVAVGASIAVPLVPSTFVSADPPGNNGTVKIDDDDRSTPTRTTSPTWDASSRSTSTGSTRASWSPT